MPSPNFLNPLLNPVFLPVILRTVTLFVVGFLAILAANRFHVKDIFASKLGQIYRGWLILTPIYFAGIFLGRIPGLIVIMIFMWLAVGEVSRIAKLPTAYKAGLLLLSACSLLVASYYTVYFYSLPLFYFIVITAIAIRRNDSKEGFMHFAISLFTSIWIIFSLSHFVLLAHLNNTIDPNRSLLLLVILAVSLSDIGAYIFGKLFHKLNFFDSFKIASNISPNKTYIGVIGHILGAAGGIAIMHFAVSGYLSLPQWALVAVLIGCFGLVGGLTNSLFKRYYEVKDSSSLLPGLGGVLDRIDSLTRVIIVLYYYFLFVF